MRRFIYSTNKVKSPKFFANMCNITGTEEIAPIEFSDYVSDTYGVDIDDLTDAEYDKYFQEYRESVDNQHTEEDTVTVSEEESVEPTLDIDLDAEIDMRSDGSWDFVDDSWATCAETKDGSWRTADDTIITTPDQLVSDVNGLLQLYLPIEKGTFQVKGNLHLTYNIDEGESMFDIANSTVKDFYSEPVK